MNSDTVLGVTVSRRLTAGSMGHAASLPTAETQAHLNKPSAEIIPHMCAEPDSGDEDEELTSAEENAVLRKLHDLRMAEPRQQLLVNFPS